MSGSEASRHGQEQEREIAPAGNEAHEFVAELTQQLAGGRIELPSFPEVALRVQRVLAREEVQDEDLLRAVGAEPAIAMRVLQMANSVALNPMGKPVHELRSAIFRVGHNRVRAASIAFVMQQLRDLEKFRHLRAAMQQLWEHSVTLGALSLVVARRCTPVNPDLALLAGVLHGVGKLYILTRAHDRPRLLADRATFDQIERDWHASIARALLEHWQISPEVIAAVHGHEDLERDMQGPIAVIDVLTAAHLLATLEQQGDADAPADERVRALRLRAVRVWQRLTLSRAACETVLEESAQELAALRQVLS